MILLSVQVLAQAVYRTFLVVQALPARAACMILPAVRISVQMAFLFSTIATIFSFSASVPESIQAVLMLSKLLLLPVQVLAQVVCMASALLPFVQAVYMALALLLFASVVYTASVLLLFVQAVCTALALPPFARMVYMALALLPFSQAVYKASALLPFAQVAYTASALLPFALAVHTALAAVLLVADTPPQALDNSAVLYD